ncbi:hypothetical protein [Vibrio vulnificus YJ016]|uniref:Uncharacterized protein n=1 Tax=Vibrio vulnificus (strain YJ016) TaxID=196600 RepID=Q7MCC8_VIBVY|nr:hypothetical protein [Vibrio vulnificus YJ016]
MQSAKQEYGKLVTFLMAIGRVAIVIAVQDYFMDIHSVLLLLKKYTI